MSVRISAPHTAVPVAFRSPSRQMCLTFEIDRFLPYPLQFIVSIIQIGLCNVLFQPLL